jgi:hypothetical protein
MGAIVLAMFAGPAMTQTLPIVPNGITYINSTSSFAANQSGIVYVQILYDGNLLKSEGVRVYFQAKDTSVIPAQFGTYTLTDANGIANYTFTAGQPGQTNLTATAMLPNSGITATGTFSVTAGAPATPTPVPSATASPVPSVSATPAPALTVTPTALPTAGPIATVVPSATPVPEDINAQGRGILAVGIVVAIILIAAIFIARMLRKK